VQFKFKQQKYTCISSGAQHHTLCTTCDENSGEWKCSSQVYSMQPTLFSYWMLQNIHTSIASSLLCK